MAAPTILEDLFAYVDFTSDDAEILGRLRPVVQSAFDGIVDEFYTAIRASETAMSVFSGGEAQILRQKNMLHSWLEGLFGGTYDHAYLERRMRIGRVHVQIGLQQHLMFSAMNILRRGLHHSLRGSELAGDDLHRAQDAVDRICDVELAVMLESYRERYDRRLRSNERLATVGEVAASIGHELRNPLAVMETSVHLLRRRTDDAKVTRHLDRIGQQIQVSSTIINDLLALARDRPPERREIDTRELLEEAAGAVPHRGKVEISVEVPADLPPLWADRTQLRQVLINLLTNGVQAIARRDGGGHVRASARASEAGGVALLVEDDGPGIDPDILDDLFEPLVTNRTHGIGLGLALCARIVEHHGGRIRGENREPPETGARFVLTMPPPAREDVE